jgi:hypothetical protein
MTGVADRDGEGVGRMVRARWLWQAQERADHVLDLCLLRRAAPANGHLHRLRCVVEAGNVVIGGRKHRDAAGLPDGERRAHVLAEIQILERNCSGLMPADQLLELGVNAQ